MKIFLIPEGNSHEVAGMQWEGMAVIPVSRVEEAFAWALELPMGTNFTLSLTYGSWCGTAYTWTAHLQTAMNAKSKTVKITSVETLEVQLSCSTSECEIGKGSVKVLGQVSH